MNCPVCKRELAPTLSICLTCGAMMNDTVREEMETKIARPVVSTPRSETPKFEPIKPWTPEPVKRASASIEAEPVKMEIVEDIVVTPDPTPTPAVAQKARPITARLNRKETSPTLVEFQRANPSIPDWRLQVQNSVRKRSAGTETVTAAAVAPAPAISSQPISPTIAQPTASSLVQNEKVANALKRIEASKKTYGSAAAVAVAKAKMKRPAVPNRPLPFNVVERTSSSVSTAPNASSPELETIKQELPAPKLVSPLRLEKKKFDTNKLPPIPEPETPLPTESTIAPTAEVTTEVRTKLSFGRMSIRNAPDPIEETIVEEIEEIDDLAPLSMRFGAAVFDLIIGGFAAGIILTPLLVSNANLASLSGGFAIAGAVVFVMFLYQTITIAFLGRTFGMKLFSIEIIDAEENELPTLHQSAVHSAVYLLSLLLLGIGFVPAFFNEERRAMHDILAGTLLIREY